MVVLITKVDTIGEDDEVIQCNTTKINVCGEVQVMSVCAQSRTEGAMVEPFGKERVIEQIFDNFWKSITSRLLERCIKFSDKFINNWKAKKIATISDLNHEGESVENIKRSVIDSLSEKHLNILVRKEIKRTMGIYGKIMSGMESIDCVAPHLGSVEAKALPSPSCTGRLYMMETWMRWSLRF